MSYVLVFTKGKQLHVNVASYCLMYVEIDYCYLSPGVIYAENIFINFYSCCGIIISWLVSYFSQQHNLSTCAMTFFNQKSKIVSISAL